MYKYSYLFLAILFGVTWLTMFLLRPDLRRAMLLTSVAISPAGQLSQYWYLHDYWNPNVIFDVYGFRIEDWMFTFFLSGTSFAISKIVLFRTIGDRIHERRPWLAAVFFCIAILALHIGGLFHINSVIASEISFAICFTYIFVIRPDLIGVSLTSGAFIAALFIINYNILDVFFPGTVLDWCTGCNPTGVRISGVNIEEIGWDYSWGVLGGGVYEACSGRHNKAYRPPSFNKVALFLLESFNSNRPKYFENATTILGSYIRRIRRRVLSILLWEIVSIPFHCIIKNGRARLASLIFFSSYPLFMYLFCGLENPETTLAFVICCDYAILNAFLLYFPALAWDGLSKLSDDLSSGLIDPAEKNAIRMRFSILAGSGLQLPLFFSGALVSYIFMEVIAAASTSRIAFYAPSYIQAIQVGALGTNAVYWLLSFPKTMYIALTFTSYRTQYSTPVATPLLARLSRLLFISSIMALVGITLSLIPIIIIVRETESHALHILLVSVVLFEFIVFSFVLASALINFIVFPFMSIVRR